MGSHSRDPSLTLLRSTIATSKAENACTTLLLSSSLPPKGKNPAVVLRLLAPGSEAQLGFVLNVDHADREQLVEHLAQHADWVQFVLWRWGDAVLLVQSLGELVTGVRRARAVAQARTLVRDFLPFSQATAAILVRKLDELSDNLVQSSLRSNGAPSTAPSVAPSAAPSSPTPALNSLPVPTAPSAPTMSPATMAETLVPTPLATPPSLYPRLQPHSNTRPEVDADQTQTSEPAATEPLPEAATSYPLPGSTSSASPADAIDPCSSPNPPTRSEEINPTVPNSTVSETLARIAALRAQYSHLDPAPSITTAAAAPIPHDRSTHLTARGLPVPYDPAPLASPFSPSADGQVPIPSSLGLSLNAQSEQRPLPTVLTQSTTAPCSGSALDTDPSPHTLIGAPSSTGTAEHAQRSSAHMSRSSLARTIASYSSSTTSSVQPTQPDRPDRSTRSTQPAHHPRPTLNSQPTPSDLTTEPEPSSMVPALHSTTHPTKDAILLALDGDDTARQRVLTARAKFHSSQLHTTHQVQRRMHHCQVLQQRIDDLSSQLASDQAAELQHQRHWLATRPDRSHLDAFDRSQVESNELVRRTHRMTKLFDVQRSIQSLRREYQECEQSVKDTRAEVAERIRAHTTWEAQVVREVHRVQRVEHERKRRVDRRRSNHQVTRDTFVRVAAPVLRYSSSSHRSDATVDRGTGTVDEEGDGDGSAREGEEAGEEHQALLAGWLSIQQPDNTLLKRRTYTLFPTYLELYSSTSSVHPVQRIPTQCLNALESVEDGAGVDHSFALHYECGGRRVVLEAATDTDQEKDAMLAALEVLTGLGVRVVE